MSRSGCRELNYNKKNPYSAYGKVAMISEKQNSRFLKTAKKFRKREKINVIFDFRNKNYTHARTVRTHNTNADSEILWRARTHTDTYCHLHDSQAIKQNDDCEVSIPTTGARRRVSTTTGSSEDTVPYAYGAAYEGRLTVGTLYLGRARSTLGPFSLALSCSATPRALYIVRVAARNGPSRGACACVISIRTHATPTLSGGRRRVDRTRRPSLARSLSRSLRPAAGFIQKIILLLSSLPSNSRVYASRKAAPPTSAV